MIINFPDPAQKSDIVQLRGPKNEVEKCAKFLQKIIADLVRDASSASDRHFLCPADFHAALSTYLQIESSFSLSVPIFKQFHKNIIGKGGANIKKVRVRLQVGNVCIAFIWGKRVIDLLTVSRSERRPTPRSIFPLRTATQR